MVVRSKNSSPHVSPLPTRVDQRGGHRSPVTKGRSQPHRCWPPARQTGLDARQRTEFGICYWKRAGNKNVSFLTMSRQKLCDQNDKKIKG